MMKQEFEALAGYEVSAEDYANVIEPMYMATSLSKQEFVKTINRKAFEVKHEAQKITVGVKEMPNGTWMVYEAELLNVNIKTGKVEVKRLSANRCWAETYFTIWYGFVEEIA